MLPLPPTSDVSAAEGFLYSPAAGIKSVGEDGILLRRDLRHNVGGRFASVLADLVKR